MSEVVPEHMDRWSRNHRLYETLKGMGLYVSPIPESDDPTKIREMIVAVDLPSEQATQQATKTGVVDAMEGSKVRDIVRSTESAGVNVINFPAVL
jgi:hypothetical protein